MRPNLSLRARLTLLLAVALAAGVALNAARLFVEAGPRVQAEDRNATQLARAVVEAFVADLHERPDPQGSVSRLLDSLRRLRHVSVGLDGAPPPSEPPEGAPKWFVALLSQPPSVARVPLGAAFGDVVVTSRPADEIAEIWDAIVTQLAVSGALAAALFLATRFVVDRALAPLDGVVAAMSRIESGDYAARVRPAGSPEVAALCRRANGLAEALGRAIEERERLAGRMVSVQDEERRDVARELHDEFGPCLFALRAHAASLLRAIGDADLDAADRNGRAIVEHLGDLQQLNRRVLGRLRPAGLAEFGLVEAVEDLVRLWREAHPQIAIALDADRAPKALDESAALTAYRVAQEALTNVYRHAGATAVTIAIAAAGDAVQVVVQDDGAGLPAGHRSGLGLMGMRERVRAQGGRLTVESSSAGVRVEAVTPMRARPAADGAVFA